MRWGKILPIATVFHLLLDQISGEFCHRPPTPERGYYEPLQPTYSVGDVVKYSCIEGIPVDGGRTVRCSTSGVWEGDFPLCGRYAEIRNVTLTIRSQTETDIVGIDGSSKTCMKSRQRSWGYDVYLDAPSEVGFVSVTSTDFPSHFEVHLYDDDGKAFFNTCSPMALNGTTIMMLCPNISHVSLASIVNMKGESDKQNTICEVQVFSPEGNPLKVLKAIYGIAFNSQETKRIMDGNPNSCVLDVSVSDLSIKADFWSFTMKLKEPSTVTQIREVAATENAFILLYGDSNKVTGRCRPGTSSRNNPQIYLCEPNNNTTRVVIYNDFWRSMWRYDICEVEVLTRAGGNNKMNCPLHHLWIENGTLLYNDVEAWPRCDEGFTANPRKPVPCLANRRWSSEKFVCEKGVDKYLDIITIIAWSGVAGIVVLSIVVIFKLRKRRKRVPTTFSCPMNEYEDHIYDVVRYSGFLGTVPLPRRANKDLRKASRF